MAREVSRLRVAEDVRINNDALASLRMGIDADGSHDAIERAIIEIARFMGAIETAFCKEHLPHLIEAAAGLRVICDRVGFMLLARVAGDAVICAERGDGAALAAVCERLVRVGDASLAAAIDGVMPPD